MGDHANDNGSENAHGSAIPNGIYATNCVDACLII